MALEDYFQWTERERLSPVVLSTYKGVGKFNVPAYRIAISGRDGTEVMTQPLRVPEAIEEVRTVVGALEDRGYVFALKDVQDAWLRDREGTLS